VAPRPSPPVEEDAAAAVHEAAGFEAAKHGTRDAEQLRRRSAGGKS
jgi:hypothetical protein